MATTLPFVTKTFGLAGHAVFFPGTLVPYLGSNLTLGERKEKKELLFIISTPAVPDTVPGAVEPPFRATLPAPLCRVPKSPCPLGVCLCVECIRPSVRSPVGGRKGVSRPGSLPVSLISLCPSHRHCENYPSGCTCLPGSLGPSAAWFPQAECLTRPSGVC